MTNQPEYGRWRRRMSRRAVLQSTGVTGLGAVGLWLSGCGDSDSSSPSPTTGNGATGPTPGSSPASTTAPVNPGERVPAITSVHINSDFWVESMRKFVADWRDIGLETNLVPVSTTEWLAAIFDRRYGDIQAHGSPLRPERFDPAEWIVSRAYGPEGVVGQRNYGNYKSRAYDAEVEAHLQETDFERRREHVFRAQEILREDWHINTLVFNSDAEVFNSDDWEAVADPIPGTGLLGDQLPYGLLEARPRGNRRRFVQGVTNGPVDSTNIVATTGGGRNVLRFIYDTLVKLDKDLSVRGWAMESWRQLDDVTWEMQLRPGMRFHDGMPVTPDDVLFTFERMMQEQPGILSLVWRPIANIEISDPGEGIVRFTTDGPRADFLTIIAMIAPILPKHVWENASELATFDVSSPETAIGSGPFIWQDYRRDDQLLLRANKDHFYAPQMDELLILNSPTVDGNIGRLQAKEIDRTVVTSRTLLEQAEGFSHVTSQVTESLGWNLILPFTERMPWRDIAVRQALSMATDKRYVSEVVTEGLSTISPAGSFMSTAGPWGNPNLEPIEFNIEGARQVLSDAGYSWDSDNRLLYPNPDDANFRGRIEQVLSRPDDWWGPGPDEVGPPDGRV